MTTYKKEYRESHGSNDGHAIADSWVEAAEEAWSAIMREHSNPDNIERLGRPQVPERNHEAPTDRNAKITRITYRYTTDDGTRRETTQMVNLTQVRKDDFEPVSSERGDHKLDDDEKVWEASMVDHIKDYV